MKKIILVLAVLLAATIMMTGCDAAVDGEDGGARALTFSHGGEPQAPVLVEAQGNFTGRSNSSGISVPSNAHSATFAALPGVYFYWNGNGQNRNFFAYVEERAWDSYCWIGVTTQQGPQGYLFHRLEKVDAPAYIFQKLHNNITQAWLEGGATHVFCEGLSCNGKECVSCDPDNCLLCGDPQECVCECKCTVLPPPCGWCWKVGCCAIKIANNVTGSNPQGHPHTIRIVSNGQQAQRRVEFDLVEDFFDRFDNEVRINSRDIYVQHFLEGHQETVYVFPNYVLIRCSEAVYKQKNGL